MNDTISTLPFEGTRWGTLSYDYVRGDFLIRLPETSGSAGGELWLCHAQACELQGKLQGALQDIRVTRAGNA